MKIKYLILSLIISSSSIFSQTDSPKHSFVGVAVCAPCHKTEKQGKQVEIWQNARHSQAYKTLQSEKSDSIAKALGHETPAVKTEACLKCHTSGFNAEASELGEKFSIEDGVQCETCHGAGSGYKNMKIMKSREESVANGLIVHEKIEDYCTGCHNPESPTYVPLNVAEAWEKIKHPVPEK